MTIVTISNLKQGAHTFSEIRQDRYKTEGPANAETKLDSIVQMSAGFIYKNFRFMK